MSDQAEEVTIAKGEYMILLSIFLRAEMMLGSRYDADHWREALKRDVALYKEHFWKKP